MSLSQQAKYALGLSSVPGMGVKTFNKLHAAFGSIDRIWHASFEQFVDSGLNPRAARAICDIRDKGEKSSPSTAVTQIETWLSEENRHFICRDDPQYPFALKQVFCAPPYLYVRGCLEAFDLPALAIVGSRNATLSGKQHAEEFSRSMAKNRFSVVSGLALGIDAAAHQGALEDDGVTLAVVATGLDMIYPKKHQGLAEAIMSRGALVSEMPLGTMPVPRNFPRRNRIISGLSQGVLVIEAGLKSGSLITANYAIEQNRELFVVPGSISNPLSKGGHALIKQGACLVESPEDIFDQLFWCTSNGHSFTDANDGEDLSEVETRLIAAMGYDVIGFDDLLVATRMDAGELMTQLMSLELKGWIASVAGGYQRMKQVKSATLL